MRAAFIHGVGDVRVAQVPSPQPREDEVLLAVRAVGICGSDAHYYLDGGIGTARIQAPLILGHEFSAEIADPRAGALGFQQGQLVAVEPAHSCRRCEWCLAGHPNLCPDVRFMGSPPGQHGALTEYVAAPADALFPVPSGFTPAMAALLEPLGVALHAVDLAHLHPMDTVAVLGAGAIGLLIVQVARASGAGRVFAIDPLPARSALAVRLGADAGGTDAGEVQAWTSGRGVDVVIEATNSDRAAAQATETVRIGGKVLLAGIPRTEAFTLNASVMRRKGITLKMVRRMKHTYPRAIDAVVSGRVDLAALATHRFPLERAADAIAMQAGCDDGVVRAIVEVEAPSS